VKGAIDRIEVREWRERDVMKEVREAGFLMAVERDDM
jgi:hypothetical protein